MTVEGSVPLAFLPATTLNDIYAATEINESAAALSRKEAGSFIASVNFATERIVSSGRLLYDDTISHYLSSILDVLLARDPGLRSKIRIYTHKSPVVNAFMLPNGMLFVNTGLVANATCEADIAFILAHEVVHYTNQHSINLHVEGLRKEWSEEQFIFDYLAYHHRSRVQETEADSRGLNEYYLAAGYHRDAVYRAFDIMQFAHLPFEEMPLMRAEVETPLYRFPDSYFAASAKAISGKTVVSDTLSTHPSIPERIKKIEEIFSRSGDKGGLRFVAPEATFEYIRDLARYECICQYLIDGKYTEAFYNSRIMLADYPGSRKLEIARVAALYGWAKMKRAGMNSKIPSEKETEGALYTVVRFFRKAAARDAALLAMRYAWNTKKKYPDDPYLGMVCKDLLTEIGPRFKLSLADFSDYGMDDSLVMQRPDSATPVTSKYAAGKAKTLVVPEKDWETYHFMIADLKQEDAFISAFNEAYRQYELDQLKLITRRKPEGSALQRANLTMHFLEPFLMLEKGSGHRKKEVSAAAFPGGIDAGRTLTVCSKQAGINPVVIAAGGGTRGEDYRRFTAARELAREVTEKPGANMVPWTAYNKDMSSSGGIDYLVVYGHKATRGGLPTADMLPYTILSVFQFPLLPVGLYHLLVPSIETSASLDVMDFRSGRLVYTGKDSFEEKPRSDYLRQFIYKSLHNSKAEILSVN